ncbi:MAG: hypothetical protein KJZ91_11780 [Myxococcales bacterium]|nr:hypothetical protein [Myxococcales bacterium]
MIPAVAIAVRAAAGLGVLEQGQGLIATLRMTLVFAGLATVVTTGGVARLAAAAYVERGRAGAVVVAARALAAGGAALTLVAAIPHGGLPTSHAGWVGLAAVGAVAGAAAGAVVGLAAGGALPAVRELGAVWRRPTPPTGGAPP